MMLVANWGWEKFQGVAHAALEMRLVGNRASKRGESGVGVGEDKGSSLSKASTNRLAAALAEKAS